MDAAGAKLDAYAHNPYPLTRRDAVDRRLRPLRHDHDGDARAAPARGDARVRARKRIWLTEFGYQTNPPDRTSASRKARRRATSARPRWRAFLAPRVDMLIHYLFHDEPERALAERPPDGARGGQAGPPRVRGRGFSGVPARKHDRYLGPRSQRRSPRSLRAAAIPPRIMANRQRRLPDDRAWLLLPLRPRGTRLQASDPPHDDRHHQSDAGGAPAPPTGPVAHPRLGDEVARPGGIGFELAADLGQVDAEVVGLAARTAAPRPPAAAAAG